jgi:hypothetical protein
METKIQSLLMRTEKIFGIKPEYLSLSDLNSIDHAHLLELVRGRSVSANGIMLMPIVINESLQGALRFPLNERSRNQELGTLVRSIIETLGQKMGQIEQLDFHESTQENLNQKPSNVVFLKDRRTKNLQAKIQTDEAINSRPAKKSVMNFPFVIEALEAHDAFCMAVNIHEHSGRYAFLTIENLDAKSFSSVEEFERLGPMTIYIDDIEGLDLNLQASIARCISEKTSSSVPQIILGTDESLRILKMSPMVNQSLLRKLTVGYLHMDQPFSAYKNGDLLRFFAESLSARLTLDL